jgi:alpha-tubulin suppressor-like RCC1 family protein
MVRRVFVLVVALAAVSAIASCEDTDGLSGGSNAADAAPDRDEDVAAPVVDGAADDALLVDASCDAPAADPAFLSDAVEIDSSGHSVCAVRASGQVVCWGDNSVGQLGVAAPDAGGTTASSERPVVVPGVPPATHVAVGYQHACAIVAGGEVWCWGNGTKGQTGANGGPTSGPVQVLGASFTPLNNVIALAAGGAFTCALAQGGGTLCWGENNQGQLGTPGGFGLTTEPIPVAGLGVATSITAGFFNACAMTGTGPKCWGGSQTGELGRTVGPEGGAPGEYSTGATITRIVASSPDTCAIDVAGNAFCSGYNLTGQLGITNAMGNIMTPFPIPELSSGNITDVDIGFSHTCGTRKDESAFCMSGMPMAALGRGPLDASSTDNAARTVEGLHPVASIKVGGKDYGSTNQHTCAIVKPACAKAGQVWCWGANGVGQLGDGTTTERARPVKVVAPQ